MPFQPVAEGVQVRMFFTAVNVPCENRFFYQVPITPSIVDLTTMASKHVTWWNTHLRPYTSNQCSLVGVDVSDERAPGGFKVEYRTGLPLQGQLASPIIANNVSKAHSLTTGRKGRSFAGRWFFVGLADVDTQSNEVNPRILDQSNSFINDLRTAMQASGAALSICSRVENKVPRPVAILTPVTAWGWTDTTTDSMRGRLP